MANLPTLQPLQSKPDMLGSRKDEKKTQSEENDVPEQRSSLVNQILTNVEDALKVYKPKFDQMRRNMFLVKNGRDEETPEHFYFTNLANRYVQSRTAAIYARNPTIVAKPKKRLNYQFWDEDLDTLDQTAARIQESQLGGIPPDPNDLAVMQDFQQGKLRENMIKKIGKTAEILFQYYADEVQPDFKTSLKQTVKRTLTNSVGFVKLDYQREEGRTIEATSGITDFETRLRHLEELQRKVEEGDVDEGDAEIEELRLGLKALREEEEVIVREGLVFGFPSSTAIIVDPACRHLKGFIGARWVAEEFWFEPSVASEIYGRDFDEIGATKFTREVRVQDELWDEMLSDELVKVELVKVYEVYDITTGLMYTVTPGFKDFVEEPRSPNVSLQQFYPFYTYIPNAIEDEDDIYPPSDVEILTPMQLEFNTSRQGLSEHRRAARPKLAYVDGSLEEDDIELLKNHPSFAVLPMKGLTAGQRIEDLLQPVPMSGVDPNLYVTNHIVDDMELALGVQEALLGASSGISATESSISQSASTTTLSSHIDELDDFLSQIARGAGEIMLKELDLAAVQEIVGPGAVWPDLPNSAIENEFFLGIEAGSSGKPNQAAELAKFEKAFPFLIQLPGVKPKKLAKILLEQLNVNFDIEDFFDAGLPSVVAQNANAQPSTGDPSTDPNAQGRVRPQQLPGGTGALA